MFNNKIQPVCLSHQDPYELEEDNRLPIFVGWGADENKGRIHKAISRELWVGATELWTQFQCK